MWDKPRTFETLEGGTSQLEQPRFPDRTNTGEMSGNSFWPVVASKDPCFQSLIKIELF